MTILVLLPVFVPLTGAAVALLLRRYQRVQVAWSIGAMVTSLVFSGWMLWAAWQGETAVYQSGGWAAPFGITLVGDLLAAVMVLMSQLVITMGMVYAAGCNDACARYPTFYPLFLMLATGLTGAMLTGDLFNLFVFAELLVISGAILTAISDDKFGTEAAFKYFYISLLAAAFLLLAVGGLYVSYGTLNMADLAARIAVDNSPALLPVSVGLLLAFFMVKSAVFPFHFWQPDFHTAAPTPVHAVLSSVVVKLGVYGFLRMTTLLFLEQAPTIRIILVVAGLIGIFYGGLGATGTYDAKRMLAYSTMGQIGFILVGIGWGTPLALAAAIVFAFNHSLIKAAMLMLAGTVASRAVEKSAAFTTITGLGKYTPLAGVLFFVGSLALAGIPPTNGFVSKMLLFRSGVAASEYVVLGVMAVGSVITLVYTMRAFQRIWWHEKSEGVEVKPYGDRLIAPALLIGLVLLLGVWGEPLSQLAADTSAWMASPAAYIEAVLGSVDVVMGE